MTATTRTNRIIAILRRFSMLNFYASGRTAAAQSSRAGLTARQLVNLRKEESLNGRFGSNSVPGQPDPNDCSPPLADIQTVEAG